MVLGFDENTLVKRLEKWTEIISLIVNLITQNARYLLAVFILSGQYQKFMNLKSL